MIEDFMPLDSDTLFGDGVAGGSATLRWCNGDRYRDDLQPDASSFLPHDEALEPNKPRRFASNMTFKYLPYFNIQIPHEGWILAVGWTGLWKADFTQDAQGRLGVRAGMQKTHFRLKPGETVRTPSMVLMHWTGDDMIVGHNQFRRLVFAHYCQKIDGKPALPPIAYNTCAAPYVRAQERNEPMGMLNEAGELTTIDYIAGLGCEVYWMDAYWYPQPWHLNIGNWYCRANDFPRGLRPLADAAHSKGMKFVLWMIPPSVGPNTKWALEHPEFIHGGGDGRGGIWKMGDPKAREWVTNWVVDLLNDWQVDIYREDGSKLPPEVEDDDEDRIGVAEMKHVEGLYTFWNDITSRSHAKLMDNCKGGGNRIDIETSRRSYYLWRSDFNDIGEGLKGENHWPRMALADQVIAGGLNLYSPFHTGPVWSVEPYSFRSCMSMGIALYGDIQRDSFPREQARKAIEELKALRPMFLGDIYPLLKLTSSQSDWYAYQLDRSDLGEGCAFFFRRPDSEMVTRDIALVAIDGNADYDVSITGESYVCGPWQRMKGREFIRPGIRITEKAASALLRYRKVARK
ncbi:MAG: alpha-galactosidase [Alphaproteobacteria bacterium]